MTQVELLLEADKELQQAKIDHEHAALELSQARLKCKEANKRHADADNRVRQIAAQLLGWPSYDRRKKNDTREGPK